MLAFGPHKRATLLQASTDVGEWWEKRCSYQKYPTAYQFKDPQQRNVHGWPCTAEMVAIGKLRNIPRKPGQGLSSATDCCLPTFEDWPLVTAAEQGTVSLSADEKRQPAQWLSTANAAQTPLHLMDGVSLLVPPQFLFGIQLCPP